MRIAILVAAIAAVVGCGASAAQTSAASTELRVSFFPEGRSNGDPTLWTLRCAPVGGTLPKPAAACRRLATMRSPFAPLRKDVQCTQIYGGPEQALIVGTYNGKRVWVLLALRNGCEIARAKKLGFLVPGFGTSAGA